MRAWYEEVWRDMPAGLRPPRLELRRGYLLGAVRAGDRVLDIGCGDGVFAAALAEAGALVTAADVADGALERARGRAPEAELVRVEPHGPWPFADGSFDVVWASEVIEHVADTERWVGEVRRVLRRGGRLLVTTPSVGALRRLAHAPDPRGQHLRFYTARSLRSLLEDMGFGSVRARTRRGTVLAQAVR